MRQPFSPLTKTVLRLLLCALLLAIGCVELPADAPVATAQAMVGPEITFPLAAFASPSITQFEVIPTAQGSIAVWSEPTVSNLIHVYVRPFSWSWVATRPTTRLDSRIGSGSFRPFVAASQANDHFVASSELGFLENLNASAERIGLSTFSVIASPIAIAMAPSHAGRAVVALKREGSTPLAPATIDLERASLSSNEPRVESPLGTSDRASDLLSVACTDVTCATIWQNGEALLLRRLSPGGTVIDPSPQVVSSHIGPAHIAQDGTHFTVVWLDTSSLPYSLRARRLAAWEAVAGPSLPVGTYSSAALAPTSVQVVPMAGGFGVLTGRLDGTTPWEIVLLDANARRVSTSQGFRLPPAGARNRPRLLRTPSGWSVVYAPLAGGLRRVEVTDRGEVTATEGLIDTSHLPRQSLYGLSAPTPSTFSVAVGAAVYTVSSTGAAPTEETSWPIELFRSPTTHMPNRPISLLTAGADTLLATSEVRDAGLILRYSINHRPTQTMNLDTTARWLQVAGAPGRDFTAVYASGDLVQRVRLASMPTPLALERPLYASQALGMAMSERNTWIVTIGSQSIRGKLMCGMTLNEFGSSETDFIEYSFGEQARDNCQYGALPMASSGTQAAVSDIDHLAISRLSRVGPMGEVIGIGWSGHQWVILTANPIHRVYRRLDLWRITPTGTLVDTAGIFIGWAGWDNLGGTFRFLAVSSSDRAAVLYQRPPCNGSEDPVMRIVDLAGPAVTTPQTPLPPPPDGCQHWPVLSRADAGSSESLDATLDVPSVDVPVPIDTGRDVLASTDRASSTDVPTPTNANPARVDTPDDGGCTVCPMGRTRRTTPYASPLALAALFAAVATRRRRSPPPPPPPA